MMKIFFAAIIFILTAVLIASVGNEGNLLVNGSFEESKDGIMPDNWNGDNHIYTLSSEAVSGRHSLKYYNSDSSVYKVCTQLLNIKPGANYSAGVKIKTSKISGGDYGASFCVEWMDENGKWMGGAFPKGIKGTNDWTEISSVISIPDNAKKVLFCCYVRKGMTGTAWFDDAFMIPYMNENLRVMMLQPVYRGLLFNEGDQDIVLSVNLDNINFNTDSSFISTGIYDSEGHESVKHITSLTGSNKNYIINLNAAALDTGNYTVTVTLTGKNSLRLQSWNADIKKITRENQPAVYFDNYKRLIINNKKVFPLGMYWGAMNENDLKVYAQSKFNFLIPYTPPTDQQMKLAEKYNLKVVYSVKDYYAGAQFAPAEIKSASDEMILLGKTIDNFKYNPSLLAWYINDEYPPEYSDRINEHFKMINGKDPNHPVLSIIINPAQADLYLNSTDVIGSDPYVVPNSQLYKVGEAAQTIARKTDNSRPVWMVIQAHNLGNYKEFIPNPQDYRTPTYDEMRSMSWQAICEGADGLIYYSYFDIKRNPDVPFDAQWMNLKRIAAEIDTVSEILLSEEKTR